MATQPCAIVGSTLSHGGTVTAGSPVTKAISIPIARVGDPATCSSHGATTITTGSTTVKDTDGKFVARITSLTACGATITSGSPTRLISD